MPTPWQWWTEAIIPTVGALASAAIAVIAIVVTVRLARVAREERERTQRLEYALAVDRALADYRARIDLKMIDYTKAESIRLAIHEVTLTMNAAAVSVRNVAPVDSWLQRELDASLMDIATEAIYGGDKSQLQALRERVGRPLLDWARTGRLVEPTPRPHPPGTEQAS